MSDEVEGIPLVTENMEQKLNERQLEDNIDHRRGQVKWILNLGKDSEKATGYAWETANQRSYRIDGSGHL